MFMMTVQDQIFSISALFLSTLFAFFFLHKFEENNN